MLPTTVSDLRWEQIYLILGFVATVYALAYLLVDKGGLDFGIGFWGVLIVCVATLVGAVLLQREGSGRSTPSGPPPAA